MLTTAADAAHLAGECNLWIDTLRAFRNKFQNHKTVLPGLASNQRKRDVLFTIEHLDNQLYIQLINIHDLKLAIKRHMQKLLFERAVRKSRLSDYTVARHKYLYDEYQRQETTLHVISREFDKFVKYISVKA